MKVPGRDKVLTANENQALIINLMNNYPQECTRNNYLPWENDVPLIFNEDLWDLLDLNTPTEKMQKLKDIMEIYRIAVDGKLDKTLLDRLLTKTLLTAKMPNLISQFAYFLCKLAF